MVKRICLSSDSLSNSIDGDRDKTRGSLFSQLGPSSPPDSVPTPLEDFLRPNPDQLLKRDSPRRIAESVVDDDWPLLPFCSVDGGVLMGSSYFFTTSPSSTMI